jgi:hypothetical protein
LAFIPKVSLPLGLLNKKSLPLGSALLVGQVVQYIEFSEQSLCSSDLVQVHYGGLRDTNSAPTAVKKSARERSASRTIDVLGCCPSTETLLGC